MNITITNRKGGPGKTTFTVNIGAYLAKLGYNVGIIDTDSQGHVTETFGIPAADGLYDIMVNEHEVADHIVQVDPMRYSTHDDPARGNLFLIRGYEKTYKINAELRPTDHFLFREIVDDFKEIAGLDVVLIDTQPSLAQLDGVIYLATDAFIYITQCEMLSLASLIRAMSQMERFNTQREKYVGTPSRVLAIIPNQYRTGTSAHQNNVKALGQRFGVFRDGGLVLPPVRLLTAWVEASQDRVPVYIKEPTGDAARDIRKIVESLVNRLVEWNVEGSHYGTRQSE